ncbi:Tetratricopeptide repeat protein [Novipirellula galeiformis]|uniref:Tetratricopeptide repeat protein n=1 Tax=Novipirellula galeiformis TaxID=2528004 RepID=A0A5C6CBP5_9BACT|nr:tetratricopeptide repeat protein [Novipirellula galeiformis]TWU22183.1 Tetratricopeptide repeat protein [Novipirellula galeiformis]
MLSSFPKRSLPLRICVIAFFSGVVFTSVFAEDVPFSSGAALSSGEALSSDDTSPTPAQLAMLEMMQQRVAKTPEHSDSWRSLGRLQNTLGDPETALASTRRAIELDPFNAAAHFDLGQLLVAAGHPDQAQSHFDRVYQIAPESAYAEQLKQQGVADRRSGTAVLGTPEISPNGPSTQPFSAAILFPQDPPDPSNQAPVQPASYAIQSFDGADDLEQRFDQLESEVLEPLHRLRVFFETGVLYNSNVTLTPISRELAQSDSASFQAFANPDLDWKWIRTETMRMGPMFRGYFTANEATFEEFNLASFQPGAFLERDFQLGQNEAIGRLEYIFANDFFDGEQVGERHSATASITLIRPDLDAIYGYLTVAQSDFRDDGLDPNQTSLDGTTVTAGISRFFQTGWDRLPTHSLGIDLESADTEGADYRYKSINLHGSAGWEITDRWKFIPTWGIGLRDYGDFTGPVARDEFFWRLHGRLQYAFTDSIAIAVVAGHDRFASDNPDYDTERSEGGLVLTFTR